MTLEQQLRELFAADADAAPGPQNLWTATRSKIRRRRITLTASVSGGCAALAAAVLIVPNMVGSPATTPQQAAAPVTSQEVPQGTVPAGEAGQPLTSDALASCVSAYSPGQIAARDFAFDGTIRSIGPARSNRGDAGNSPDLRGVTFHVNQWFKGGNTTTVVVDLPTPADQVSDDYAAPAYGIGTRLLVSGAARWGGSNPLASAIAWTCGGFTRYYSPADAAAWAAAIRDARTAPSAETSP